MFFSLKILWSNKIQHFSRDNNTIVRIVNLIKPDILTVNYNQTKKACVSKNIMAVTLVLGIGCFVLFEMIGSTVDSNVILHEPFF